MINVLVTVGTTTFDSLIKALDKPTDEVEIFFQIANGAYLPVHHPYQKFVPDLSSKYSNYDLIVTHAGAGSIYTMLDMNLKFVVVPNLERSDKHQLELSKFVEINNYAKTYLVENLTAISIMDVLQAVQVSQFVPYQKELFFKGKEIIEFVCSP